MRAPLNFSLVTLLLGTLSLVSADQFMPQDGWTYEGKKVLGAFRSICMGKDGRVYVGAVNKVAVYTRDLVPVGEFGSFTGPICGLACDSQTNIYVLESDRVKVFDPYGTNPSTMVRSWGGTGTNTGLFRIATFPSWNAYGNGLLFNASDSGLAKEVTASGIAVNSLDEVIVADGDNTRVQVFSRLGAFLRKWGQPEDSPINPLLQTTSVAVLPDDRVVVVSGGNDSAGNQSTRLDIYEPDGRPILVRTFFEAHTLAAQYSTYNLASTPDGLIVGSPDNRNKPGTVQLYETSALNVLRTFTTSSLRLTGPDDSYRIDGQTFGSGGRWYALVRFARANSSEPTYSGADGIYVLERQFPADLPMAQNFVPQPLIQRSAQRSGVSYLDIDYKVLDSDSPTVEVAMLAFTNGVNTLSGLVRMNTFAEGTSANLGAGIPANTTKRVTWDVASDWNVGFGNIQFEILAKDERGLFPFHFITVPATLTAPAIKVSDRAPTDGDFLSLWFWLVATADTGVIFLNGEIFGAPNGPDAGVKFASGITTTQAGRTYLLSRLGVRSPTNAEVIQANEGRFGFPGAVTSLHVVKVP